MRAPPQQRAKAPLESAAAAGKVILTQEKHANASMSAEVRAFTWACSPFKANFKTLSCLS